MMFMSTHRANIGGNQFHLPGGKPNAQALDGVITLPYPDIDGLKKRCREAMDSNF